MQIQEYIKDRLDNQQKWYSKKSGVSRKYYERIKIVTIILAVIIPLISGLESFLPTEFSPSLISGIIGAAIAVLTSVSGFMKFQEKWMSYRSASERLKSEKMLWSMKAEPYDSAAPDLLLVQRVEGILKAEHGDWTEYMSKPYEADATDSKS